MISEKRQAANQQNALLSTGPRSEAGKSTSSRNAISHGIFSNEIVIAKGELQEKEMEYAELLDELLHDLKPEGQLQTLLVNKIAVNYWRLRRLLCYETAEVRRLLDIVIQKFQETEEDEVEEEERFSPLKADPERPPRFYHFSLKDQLTNKDLQVQKDRVDSLRMDSLDYSADREALEFVLDNRLNKDAAQATAKDRKQAGLYLRNLSPQQKGKIKRELLEVAVERYKEMKQIIKWQQKAEIIKLCHSIPYAGDIYKVIKYESALERSILKNLTMLMTLQNERKKTCESESS